jgi:xylulokinase
MWHFMSIDLGTSSCKICIIDINGSIITSSSASYKILSPHAGWMEEWPGDWIEALVKTITNIKNSGFDFKSLASITITSAAHIAVIMDKAGNPLRNALLWCDQRSREEADEIRAAWGSRILELGCNNITPSWTLAHLAWVQKHEAEVWKQVKAICFSKDYIGRFLTDEVKTDPATAVSALLYDAREGRWSEEICAIIGLNPAMLPAIAPQNAVIGKVSQKAANLSGLPEGIPVINGTLDSAMDTYGAGCVNAGDAVIRIGTAGGIHVVRRTLKADPKLLNYPFPTGELWYSQAGTNSAGSAIAYAAGLDLSGTPGSEAFDAFSSLAACAEPGSAGIIFHPYLSGERTPYWNSNLRGTFTGISFKHRKEHYARAVLEGVCFSLVDAFSAVMEETRPGEIKIVGGGARDAVLMRILSSVFNRRLAALPGVDSAYGAALFGLRLENPEAANTAERHAVFYNPKDSLISVYERNFSRYKAMTQYLIPLYNKSGI